MSPNEAAILRQLATQPAPVLLREIGGARCTHHSVSAARCVDAGWASREVQRPGKRPRYAYAITEVGRQALANRNATVALDNQKRRGGR